MRKVFLVVLILCVVLNIFGVDMKKILIMDAQSIEPYQTVREAMIKELALSGYKEGKNLLIDHEILGNFEGRGYNILKYGEDKNYDVIVLNGTICGNAAKKFLDEKTDKSKFKFIFVNITDPVGIGLVDNLGIKTKGNFTGIAYPVKVEERLRFIKKIFGNNVKVGYIYADMPQSHSYNKWLEEALSKSEFKDMKFFFRKVEFVKADTGTARMAMLAEIHVKELNDKVDIFLSPNDQMGSSNDFSTMVFSNSTKPLIGLANEKGSTLTLGPDLEKNGKKLAEMLIKLFNNKKITDIIPQNTEVKYSFDQNLIKKFNINLPKEFQKPN